MDKKRKEKLNMELAQKIFDERKRLGLSQEQFAEQMGVSRQAVSKWESGQSMPDLDKLVLMSEVFGVSTDYLLKETGREAASPGGETVAEEAHLWREGGGREEGENIRRLRAEEIREYQKVNSQAAARISLGVVLCILGVVLSQAAGLYFEFKTMHTDLAVVPMLVFIAAAVGLFIFAAMRLEKYEFLKKEAFLLPEGERERLTEEYRVFSDSFIAKIAVGVILCIVAVIGSVICTDIGETSGNLAWDHISAMVLLVLVAPAVFIFIRTGIRKGFYDILLQKNDFAADKKNGRRKSEELLEGIAGVYWCIVTAGFLAYSFITGDWGRSWIVWPVAGCLFGAISVAVDALGKKHS